MNDIPQGFVDLLLQVHAIGYQKCLKKHESELIKAFNRGYQLGQLEKSGINQYEKWKLELAQILKDKEV